MSIIHPITHKQYNVCETRGRELLKKYIAAFMNGGSSASASAPDPCLSTVIDYYDLLFFRSDLKHDIELLSRRLYQDYSTEINILVSSFPEDADDALVLRAQNSQQFLMSSIGDVGNFIRDFKMNPDGVIDIWTEEKSIEELDRDIGTHESWNLIKTSLSDLGNTYGNYIVIRDTCNKKIYEYFQTLKTRRNSIEEHIGYPQFLDPAKSIYPPPDTIGHNLVYDGYHALGKFNELCNYTTTNKIGETVKFFESGLKCELSLLPSHYLYSLKLNIKFDSIDFDIIFPNRIDGRGPVSYPSNKNIFLTYLFFKKLFGLEQIGYSREISEYTWGAPYTTSIGIINGIERLLSEYHILDNTNRIVSWYEIGDSIFDVIKINNNYAINYTDENKNLQTIEIKKEDDICFSIIDGFVSSKVDINRILGADTKLRKKLLQDLFKMLYTLKHNGDGGIVKMAQSYCERTDLYDTCLFFVTGDRLCIYDFLRKYVYPRPTSVGDCKPKIPVRAIYYSGSKYKIYEYLPRPASAPAPGPAPASTSTSSRKRKRKRKHKGGMKIDTVSEEEEKERLRELLLEVFMNFDEISDTKEFTYTNLFDFDDTKYLYNLNYELSKKTKQEWEFTGFKNKLDFIIYKALSFDTIDIKTLPKNKIQISNNYKLFIPEHSSNPIQLIQIVKGKDVVINEGKDISIYLKYILKNGGFYDKIKNMILDLLTTPAIEKVTEPPRTPPRLSRREKGEKERTDKKTNNLATPPTLPPEGSPSTQESLKGTYFLDNLPRGTELSFSPEKATKRPVEDEGVSIKPHKISRTSEGSMEGVIKGK